jgi:hypothetical protein
MVEATSLQSVIDLAANPPPNPNGSGLPIAEPLILYIARVPGSRDVFLTPMKPREKVVTAEDVQSSLYYVHVSSEEDYESPVEPTFRPSPFSRPSSVNTNSSQLPPLSEKPELPQRPKRVPPPLPKRPASHSAVPRMVQPPPYPLVDNPYALPNIDPPKQQQQISRKPVLADITNRQSNDLPSIPTHPLPPTPTEPAIGPPIDESSRYADNLRRLRSSSHLSEHDNPYSRNYDSHPETLKQQELDAREALKRQDHEARETLKSMTEIGSLTLIRRDPGSSQQWNVASVYDPPVHEVSSSNFLLPDAKKRTKKGGTPVYLDIINPGYVPFIGAERPTSAGRPSNSSASSETSEPPPDGTFRRRLYMPGSQHGSHAYSFDASHRKSSSISAACGEASLRPTMRSERHSVDLGAVADRRTKGYTFLSPWDGTCEFATTTSGRSLRCRHRLGNSVEEVSELRFNLPTSSKLPHKPSSYLTKLRRQNSDFGDEDDEFGDGHSAPSIMLTDDGRIDLSLGQERAGGGFGGKQAKLGKLVIMPSGVKMLDLLVAANVGLWWRAWERV